jgi:hypothetical protein
MKEHPMSKTNKVKQQINEAIVRILDKMSDRLTGVARQTRQNTDAIAALTDRQRVDTAGTLTRLNTLNEDIEAVKDYAAHVDQTNNDREARQTVRDQSNVQSLYNLRDSVQKSFDVVRKDVESLVVRAQRFNERLGQIESQNLILTSRMDALASSALSAHLQRFDETLPQGHAWVNKKLTGVYDSITELEERTKQVERLLALYEDLRKAQAAFAEANGAFLSGPKA